VYNVSVVIGDSCRSLDIILTDNISELTNLITMWVHEMVKLFEALCYKPESSGFDSRWCYDYSLTILPAVLWLCG
jgi:hypothetical protein